MSSQKTVLIAPLNWGLGHATRCIPIIRFLQTQQVNIILASDGRALHLLKKEFPNLTALELPSYGITYPTTNMVWNIAIQMPKFFKTIFKERKAIQKICMDHKVDVIISDNRFGVFYKGAYSIFLTHQINLPIPIPGIRAIGNWFNKKVIKGYDECWVPDFKSTPNLAGNLSHGYDGVRFIGPLSRMNPIEATIRRKAIVILSGPEPQRTILETKIPYKCIAEKLKEGNLFFDLRFMKRFYYQWCPDKEKMDLKSD